MARVPWLGHARYEFHGHVHSFVADLHITENDGIVPITIQGVVTRGWLKGARVTGRYRQWDTCPIHTCFQGTLVRGRPGRRRATPLPARHLPPSG